MKFWEIKQQANASDTLDLYIYSNVEGDSWDWWTGETIQSETSANYFREALDKYVSVKQINIYINSLGGSVMEGVAIYNKLKRNPAQKTVYVDGFACSVASVIAMAGDKVVMPKNTVMMIHNAWTYVAGNAVELRKAADDLDTMNTAFRQAYLLKAGEKLAEDKLIEMLDAETYLTAEQCVEYGLADEFAEVEADIDSAKQMLQQAKQNNIKQYTDKLEKICALAKSSEPPKQEEIPPEPPENKAVNFISKFLK